MMLVKSMPHAPNYGFNANSINIQSVGLFSDAILNYIITSKFGRVTLLHTLGIIRQRSKANNEQQYFGIETQARGKDMFSHSHVLLENCGCHGN